MIFCVIVLEWVWDVHIHDPEDQNVSFEFQSQLRLCVLCPSRYLLHNERFYRRLIHVAKLDLCQ